MVINYKNVGEGLQKKDTYRCQVKTKYKIHSTFYQKKTQQ